MTPDPHRPTPPRWRCKACRSTRVTAIFEGIVHARLDPLSSTPSMGEVVQDFHPHDDGQSMCSGSLQCDNCQHDEARYES